MTVNKEIQAFRGRSSKEIRALAAYERKPEKLNALLAYAQSQRTKFAAAGKSASKLKLWDKTIAEVSARMGVGGLAPAPAFTFTEAPASTTKRKASAKPKAKAVDPQQAKLAAALKAKGLTMNDLLALLEG